jgi:hypothetical protein
MMRKLGDVMRDLLHDRPGWSTRRRTTGTAWERTPRHATQRAAWEVLRQDAPGGCA